jgi:hypothetical protein
MLQSHSFLWHYLWVGPRVLQAAFAVFLWRRALHRQFPVFFAYTIFEAIKGCILYTLDILPTVSGETFWSAYWVGVIAETILVLGVIGELFLHLLRLRPVMAKVGSRLISGAGAVLILLAVAIAAYTPIVHRHYALVSSAGVFQRSSYLVECGLVLFLFLFAAHFKLGWNHRALGIALGFAVVWCEQMAVLALIAGGVLSDKRLDFLSMATYHVCVLIWSYYLLVPEKVATTSAVSLPENNLDIWNRELERLLQQ